MSTLEQDWIDTVQHWSRTPESFATPYAAGFDSAVNGANEMNCDFRWFGSQESTREWERGHAEGKVKV